MGKNVDDATGVVAAKEDDDGGNAGALVRVVLGRGVGGDNEAAALLGFDRK